MSAAPAPAGQAYPWVETGRRVLRAEAAALAELALQLDAAFAAACELLLACRGRVVVCGMGKSGLVGRKIAASLSSTGIAAQFLHPAEGMHGDLGIVQSADVLLALSRSGETPELLDLLPPLRRAGVPIIAITAHPESTLGRTAQAVLSLGNAPEADQLNLVPTTSTSLTQALGDALVVALMEARGFTQHDFALLHPQGMLGRRLTLTVADLLRGPATNPIVQLEASLGSALHVITEFALGGTSIVDTRGQLAGILTDGDIRRILEQLGVDGLTVASALEAPVERFMTRQPSVIDQGMLAYDALQLMENHRPRPIFIVPVLDGQRHPVGMLHLHALVQAGFRPGETTLPQV
jgi:arabinose-5-phosphate isomerase